MKNEFLEGFLDNLIKESGSKKKLIEESDLQNYLDDEDEDDGSDLQSDIDRTNDHRRGIFDDDEESDTYHSAKDRLRSKKEYGKVYISSNSYQLGRTGRDLRYRVDYDKLLLVLNDTLKKRLTRSDIKKIVKLVKLELGVGSESEKSDL